MLFHRRVCSQFCPYDAATLLVVMTQMMSVCFDLYAVQLIIAYDCRSAMPLQYQPEAQVCQCPFLIEKKRAILSSERSYFFTDMTWFGFYDNLWILSTGPPEMRRHKRRIWLSPRVRWVFSPLSVVLTSSSAPDINPYLSIPLRVLIAQRKESGGGRGLVRAYSNTNVSAVLLTCSPFRSFISYLPKYVYGFNWF